MRPPSRARSVCRSYRRATGGLLSDAWLFPGELPSACILRRRWHEIIILLARAVASLEQNTADARQAVYDHARRVLREQVRDLKPALSVSKRMDEMLALEEAIRKVESEAAGAP